MNNGFVAFKLLLVLVIAAVFILDPLCIIHSSASAEEGMPSDAQSLTMLMNQIRSLQLFGNGWSQFIARGNLGYKVDNNGEIVGFPYAYLMLTEYDGRVVIYLSRELYNHEIEKIVENGKMLGRSWSAVRVYCGITYIALDNFWTHDANPERVEAEKVAEKYLRMISGLSFLDEIPNKGEKFTIELWYTKQTSFPYEIKTR